MASVSDAMKERSGIRPAGQNLDSCPAAERSRANAASLA